MPTPTAMIPGDAEEAGRRVADRYRIVRKIGEGGMGSVFEAVHELLGRRVALKTLSPSRVRGENATSRFHREARAAASIESPHVVEVFDFGTDTDGSPFLVMELLEGEDMARRLAREPRLSLQRAISIARQACEALAAAHARGIVHRDVKPENLFLCERTNQDDFVKVLDFGIAQIDRSADAPTVTTTGSLRGTPRYLAPEQIEGFELDGRTDVYALAVVLYRALAGFEPFQGPTHHMLLLRILADDPPSLRRVRPDVSDELEHVIFRALAKRPDDRFESASAFAEALARFTPSAAGQEGDAVRALVDEPTLRTKPVLAIAQRRVAPYVRRQLPKHAWLVAWPLVAASMAAGFRVARSTRPATLRPVATRRPAAASGPPLQSALPQPSADARVSVELRILPACAQVTLDGESIPNPSTIRRAASTRPVKIHATCAEMPTLDAELVFDHDQRVVMELPREGTDASRLIGSTLSAGRALRREQPEAEEPEHAEDPVTQVIARPTPAPAEPTESSDGFLDDF